MICYILDDQYGKKIYQGLSKEIDAIFPIQTNILNPLEHLNQIIKTQPDFILLDNYFPNRESGREEPLGNEFLEKLLTHHLTSKIICISDYGKRLLQEYDGRKQAFETGMIIGFTPSKDPQDILQTMQLTQLTYC